MAQLVNIERNSLKQPTKVTDIFGVSYSFKRNRIGNPDTGSLRNARNAAERASLAGLQQRGLRLDSGEFVDIETGKSFGSDLNTAIQSSQSQRSSAEGLAEARGGFEQLLSQFRGEIESAGAEQEDLATSQSARRFGTLANQVRSTLLSQGRDPQQIEAILAGGQEQQERNLGDLLSQISSGTQERLAGATQLELGTNLNLEGIQTQRQGLQNALFQFLSSQSQQQSQFDQTMAMQPTGFEQILGQLAGGIGQGVGMFAGSKFG